MYKTSARLIPVRRNPQKNPQPLHAHIHDIPRTHRPRAPMLPWLWSRIVPVGHTPSPANAAPWCARCARCAAPIDAEEPARVCVLCGRAHHAACGAAGCVTCGPRSRALPVLAP
jgi:hypothetical protein